MRRIEFIKHKHLLILRKKIIGDGSEQMNTDDVAKCKQNLK